MFVQPACIFDIVHTSAIVEANFFAWAMGISLGLLASGYLARRTWMGSA